MFWTIFLKDDISLTKLILIKTYLIPLRLLWAFKLSKLSWQVIILAKKVLWFYGSNRLQIPVWN